MSDTLQNRVDAKLAEINSKMRHLRMKTKWEKATREQLPRLEKELEELQRMAAAERKVELKTIPQVPTRVRRSVFERRRLEAEAKRPDNIDIKDILASMDATMKKMKEKEHKEVALKSTWDGKTIELARYPIAIESTLQVRETIDTVLPRRRYNITATLVKDHTDGTSSRKKIAKIEDRTSATPVSWVLDALLSANDQPNKADDVEDISSSSASRLEDIKIREITDARMSTRRLRAGGMMYPHKLLGDVSAININPGQCVLDYIIAEYHNKGMRLTRPDLIEQLGGADEVKDGVSTDMIYNWAERKQNISMYALDPFGKVYQSLRATTRCDLLLVFIVNNDHVFPILDDGVKGDVSRSKKLAFAEFAMTADWTDIGVWDLPEDWDDLQKCDVKAAPVTNKTVLVDAKDLGALAMTVTGQTSQYVYNCVIPEGALSRVAMFEHPVTSQVIVAAPQWKLRKEVLAQLHAKDHYIGYEWKNQTWGLIGQTIFERTVGTLRPSQYGPQLLRYYEHSTLKPLVYDTMAAEAEKPALFTAIETRRREELGLDDRKVSIDTQRAYTSFLQNNTDPFPCYAVTDEERPWSGGEWIPGEYVVRRRCKIMPWTMRGGKEYSVEWPSDLYPLPLVREMLEEGHIAMEDITHVYPASYSHSPKSFADFATLVHESFPAEAKHIINHLIGFWGKQMVRKTEGCVTSEWDIACAMINENLNTGMQVHELGNLCFLRRYTETRMTEGHLPIWRHIIAMSIVNLMRMHKKLVGPNTVVYGYSTDAIKLKNPLPFTLGKTPGNYQIEAKCFVRGNNYVSKKDGAAPQELKWTDVPKERLHEVKGCLVTGLGGSWKTTTLLELMKLHEQRLVVAYTRQAVGVINARAGQSPPFSTPGAPQEAATVGAKRVPPVATSLDAAFPHGAPDHKWIAAYKNKTAVFLDEFSTVKPKYFSKLWKLKYRNNPVMYCFGGNEQTKPNEDTDEPYNRINYETSAIMWYLCGGNRCRLPYMGGRYDAETYAKLNTLLETGVMDWGEKKLWDAPRTTLCKQPITRIHVNAARYAIERKGKDTWRVENKEYYAGMPLIAYSTNDSIGIENSQHYNIISFERAGVKVSNQKTGKVALVPDARMDELFRYGWCDTIARVQGGELSHEYNIVDLGTMDRNDLYTAVSRTTKWDYIGVDPSTTRAVYPPATYPFVCRMLGAKEAVKPGVIYEKRWVAPDPEAGKLFYIGRTGHEEKRKKQHIAKPTSKVMAAALARPHETITIKECLSTKRQLDALETEAIRDAIMRGETLLNKKKVKGIKRAEPVAVIKHTVIVTKYPILDDIAKQRLNIRWGKEKKVFGYARCGKEAAMRKAEEFRNNLIKELLL